MNIQEMLQQTNAVGAISRELGIDPATAQAGAAALMPQILAGFQQPAAPAALAATGEAPEAQGFGGLGGLLGTITSMGGGALLDNVTSNEPTQVSQGNEILGQIFGSKDGSRAVAAQAAQQSGVEPSILKKMLPVLAMAAAGYVARNAGQGQGGPRRSACRNARWPALRGRQRASGGAGRHSRKSDWCGRKIHRSLSGGGRTNTKENGNEYF
jgi:hypothetical protein